MPTEWNQGACQCTNDMGVCCYTCWCPCLAFKEAADNIGDDNGILYCLATFPLGCGCCALTALGQTVAEKRGIESDIVSSGAKSCFDACCCYSCTVVNESRVYKEQGKAGVTGQAMDRK